MKSAIDIAFLADSYLTSELPVFLQDVANVKAELDIRLWQRKNQFNFIPVPYSKKNNFHCMDSNAWEGSTCNMDAVRKAVKASGIIADHWHILCPKINGGGGGPTSISSTSFHDRLHSGELGLHEISHPLLGLTHDGGFMSSSSDFGAGGWYSTFTIAQLATINNRMNQLVGVLNSPPPTVTILEPKIFGSQVSFTSKTTGNVQHGEIFFDGVLKDTSILWGNAERVPYHNPIGGFVHFFNNLATGSHEYKIKVYDINGQTAESSIIINI